ncbi:MAG: PIG-L deacetylase family protein [Limisphaerales bacterium]
MNWLAAALEKGYTVRMKAFVLTLSLGLLWSFSALAAESDGKLRIIAFGAHPDDCELQAGGTAAMWAAKGHRVKFVSVTNGDIGHWREAGGPLAVRRNAEVVEAARILGVETEVLDIHDGELLPTLENRKLITKAIREWNADLVLGPRPNDYHPDHRYTGILVQDAAYMVTVPFFCPDIPHMTNNPVFMYYPDRFQKPNPFKPDVVVATDAVIEKRLDALDAMPSQFYEGGANGHAGLVPSDEGGKKARAKTVRDNFRSRYSAQANRFRKELEEWYGARGKDLQYAEGFEICEYGKQPTTDDLKKMFPFHGD